MGAIGVEELLRLEMVEDFEELGSLIEHENPKLEDLQALASCWER